MSSHLSETTSAEISPSTMATISCGSSLNGLPAFATSDGFVVTPSSNPIAAASRISLMLPVSMKIFMMRPFLRLRCSDLFSNARGNLVGEHFDLGAIAAFDQQTRFRFGAGITQEHAAFVAEIGRASCRERV